MKEKLLLRLTIALCMLTECVNTTFPSEQQLTSLFEGYNSKIPPIHNGTAIQDNIQLYILSIDSVSETSMDYSMSFYLRQIWSDYRLKYNFSNVEVLEIDTKMIEKLWVPDVYIINEKNAIFHDIIVPNKLINIYPDGRIFYSARFSGTFSCSMELYNYPLDRQICDIRFQSYAFSENTVVLRWQENASVIKEGLELPQFNLTKHKPFICDETHYGVNYTCVGLKFYLDRNKGYFIIQVYVPSILIIVLSWVNFWVTVDAVPARISLGLLTVLTMTTQSAAALKNLHKVSYINALDVWLAVCLVSVFAAFIEFAYVNVSSRVEQRRKNGGSVEKTKKKLEFEGSGDEEMKKRNRVFKAGEKSRQIDSISRIVFPVIFLFFNMVYWTFYLLWEYNEE